jgi:hypothetical protein
MRAILFILCGSLLAVTNRPTLQACGIAPQHGGNGVSIASESALIVFDAKAKVQHFLRTANFDTSSSEFGFFVPTPTQPELTEASAEVFGELAKLTAPRVIEKIEHRTKMPSVGCGGIAMSKFDAVGAAIPAAANPVRVLDSKRIGRFDAVVLQATDAGKLQEWLNENKYATRPALEQWFDIYIQKGWFLVAFKIAAEPGRNRATNEAIRISFPTEVPIYPYREPADAAGFAGSQSSRLFRLFVMSDSRVSGKLGTDPWNAGKTVWSKRIEEPVAKSLLSVAKVPEAPGSFVLTEFEDTSFPRKGTDDITFSPAADQTEIQRPDVIRITVEYSHWPEQLLCIVLGSMPFLIPIAGILIWRRMRRRK